MSKLCPYDKLPCNPGCILYQAKDTLINYDEEKKALPASNPAHCRKFGVM